MALLDKVKDALRVKSDALNSEISDLIEEAQADLGIAGVTWETLETDHAVVAAIKTYCKLHFGVPDEADFFKKAYDEQKAQLATNTGHTDWLEG